MAAGDVERSAVLVRMRSRDGMSQMPPLGTKRVDTAAFDLIGAWVVDQLPSVHGPLSRVVAGARGVAR